MYVFVQVWTGCPGRVRGLEVDPAPENQGVPAGERAAGESSAQAGRGDVFHTQLSTPGARFDPGPDLAYPGPNLAWGGSEFGPLFK